MSFSGILESLLPSLYKMSYVLVLSFTAVILPARLNLFLTFSCIENFRGSENKVYFFLQVKRFLKTDYSPFSFLEFLELVSTSSRRSLSSAFRVISRSSSNSYSLELSSSSNFLFLFFLLLP